MSVAYDSSVSFAAEDQTTPTSTDAWEIASTANRWAIAGMLSRDFAGVAAHDAMALEGASMSQLGSTSSINGDTSSAVSAWNLVNPAAGTDRTLVGTLSNEDGTALLVGGVYNDVDQTTPVGSMPTPTEGSWEALVDEALPHPSITGTTVTNGVLLALLSYTSSNGSPPSTLVGTGVTVRQSPTRNGNTLYLLEKGDTGGTTTIEVTPTMSSASDGQWRMMAFPVQPASAPAPQPPSFGRRQDLPSMDDPALGYRAMLNPRAWA